MAEIWEEKKKHSKRWSPNASLWYTEIFTILTVSVMVWTPQKKGLITRIRLHIITGAGSLFNDLVSAFLRSAIKEEGWARMSTKNLGGWTWSHSDNWENQVEPVSIVPGALHQPSEHKKYDFSFTSTFQISHKFLLWTVLAQNHTGKLILEKEF